MAIDRSKTPVLAIICAVAAVVLWAPGVRGQDSANLPPAAANRTPSGHPDFTGTWSAATLTRLERPESAGGRLELTKEEAEAVARDARERIDADAAPSDPNRSAPSAGGSVGGYNQSFFDRGSSVIVIDGKYRSSIIVDPPDGRIPPMTPEGLARDAALGGRVTRPDVVERGGGQGVPEPETNYQNPEERPLSERCLLGFGWTSGTPMLPNYNYNNGKQIIQTPDAVLIFAEMIHDVRVVRMGGQHVPSQIREWKGDSIGHWEGDTLIVESTNFTDKSRFQGSSKNLKVTERFRLLDENTLLYRFTVEDPSTWTQPWTGEYTWERVDEPLYEYACHEGNYALGGVMRGARLLDQERAAKTKADGKAGSTPDR